MSDNADTFDTDVVRAILANNNFGISEVRDIESLKSLYFEHDKYPEIEKLIRAGNLKAIEGLKNEQAQISEYLEIKIFKD